MGRPPFVDAHVHLWDLNHLRYAWLSPPFTSDGPNGSVEAIARTYLLDDYLADAAGWDERLLAAHDAHRNVRGIRHIVNWHPNPQRTYTPRDVTRDEAWAAGFALLAKYDLSFDLHRADAGAGGAAGASPRRAGDRRSRRHGRRCR